MSTGEIAFLVLVVSAFTVFGISLFTVDRRCSR